LDLLSFWAMLGCTLLIWLLSLLLEETTRAWGLLGVSLLTMPRQLAWVLLGVTLLTMLTPLQAQRKRVKKKESLGPLGSNPNMGENKGQSNMVLLTGCC